ncbi:multicopper oxidase family protein [Dictyobacter formicarum]|uniref:Copper-containing nitrite reductase n=1 Tax=Dictyobacter formicarum TaxID=2778368 RepID=A0ABQ3VPR6_9CHLR|nr:multicopper oxidase family protein [Dictyobacter formicarum]GHO87371.1 copper oxidase [Dictyobacter formicarum]
MQRTLLEEKKKRNIPVICVFVAIACLLVLMGFLDTFVLKRPEAGPPNPPAASVPLKAPELPTGAEVPQALNMGMPGAPISVTDLQATHSTAPEKHFTLTAEAASLALDHGAPVQAWTFNGSAPGPTLRVRQGDMVVVTLINHLSFGVTIHWHGVSVPNADDGVAGVTQNAVKPGQSYTYRFLAKDAGTYWYHSHQFSYTETTGGLYGMLIVDPASPQVHDDVDSSVTLHDWNGANNQTLLAINTTTGTVKTNARAGQWVRLRVLNSSSDQHTVTLLGAPFMVAALDGHDVNAPQWLNQTPLPIGAAQRYDLRFQMPRTGAVTLVTSANNRQYQSAPAVVLGQGTVPGKLPAVSTHWFNLDTYGQPAPDPITTKSHFDVNYGITLNNHMGDSLGRMGMVYTLNGKVFPQTGMIMLKEGQLVKMHLDNQSDLIHPIHLHGHVFTVLTHNGHALTGSPIHLDTINIQPHDSYDIAFLANNPGIWMLHCHNLLHANWGMDMMVMYDISTPYSIGRATGNFPD